MMELFALGLPRGSKASCWMYAFSPWVVFWSMTREGCSFFCSKMSIFFIYFHLILAARFPLVGLLATHFNAGWLPMIGARQPSGLNC